MEYRIERDSMGEVKVPVDAFYGASTQRAVDNFPVSGIKVDRRIIWAFGLLKGSAAEVSGADGFVAREHGAPFAADGDFGFRPNKQVQRLEAVVLIVDVLA